MASRLVPLRQALPAVQAVKQRQAKNNISNNSSISESIIMLSQGRVITKETRLSRPLRQHLQRRYRSLCHRTLGLCSYTTNLINRQPYH